MIELRIGECVRDPVTGWVLELVDGWAGGMAWYKFDIKTGWYAGKSVWFCEDEYLAQPLHDQYETFNSDRPHRDHPDDEPMGGGCFLELNGCTFERLGISMDHDDVMEPARPEHSVAVV